MNKKLPLLLFIIIPEQCFSVDEVNLVTGSFAPFTGQSLYQGGKLHL